MLESSSSSGAWQASCWPPRFLGWSHLRPRVCLIVWWCGAISFTSLVICELIAVVTRTSKRLGLGWRNHVMALGNGWTAWAVVAILVDGLHSYFGAERYFRDLEHVRIFASLAVLAYWMVQFWQEEPARKPISPELRAYIEALHRRIKNDLDTLGAQR